MVPGLNLAPARAPSEDDYPESLPKSDSEHVSCVLHKYRDAVHLSMLDFVREHTRTLDKYLGVLQRDLESLLESNALYTPVNPPSDQGDPSDPLDETVVPIDINWQTPDFPKRPDLDAAHTHAEPCKFSSGSTGSQVSSSLKEGASKKLISGQAQLQALEEQTLKQRCVQSKPAEHEFASDLDAACSHAEPSGLFSGSTMRCSSGSAQSQVSRSAKERASKLISGNARLQALKEQTMLQRCAQSKPAELAFAFCILSNCVILAISVDIPNENAMLTGLQVVFCLVFLLELGLRIYCDKWRFFRHDLLWNLFDSAATISSIVEIGYNVIVAGNLLANSPLTRTLRFLRVIRLAKRLKNHLFRELRLMLHCLVNCVKPFSAAVIVLSGVLYVFGFFLTQGVREHTSPAHLAQPLQNQLSILFSSTLRTMYTLMSALFGGMDWRDVALLLGHVAMSYEVVFVVYIGFGYMALLNVVIGVFIDCCMHCAMKDKQALLHDEMMRQGLHRKELQHVFMEADINGEGVLPVTVLQEHLEDERVHTYLNVLEVVYSDPEELICHFHLHDASLVSIDEFVQGCLQSKSIKEADLHKAVSDTKRTVKSIKEDLHLILQGKTQMANTVLL